MCIYIFNDWKNNDVHSIKMLSQNMTIMDVYRASASFAKPPKCFTTVVTYARSCQFSYIFTELCSFHWLFLVVIIKHGSRKFCQRGSNSDTVLVDEGRDDPNTAKSGPSSAHMRNAINMAFRWPADGRPTLNAVFVAL